MSCVSRRPEIWNGRPLVVWPGPSHPKREYRRLPGSYPLGLGKAVAPGKPAATACARMLLAVFGSFVRSRANANAARCESPVIRLAKVAMPSATGVQAAEQGLSRHTRGLRRITDAEAGLAR